MNAVETGLFSNRISAICTEMGAALRRTAFSPNIRDRLDFSCAIFDRHGGLCAQAAHIPVHLGSMAYAMADIIADITWKPGDVVILNDPYLGGTHLPDVTLIAPVFGDNQLLGFVADRAHHADIGASTPGSLPLACRLQDEGLVIAPHVLVRNGEIQWHFFDGILQHLRNPDQSKADFLAQLSAVHRGQALLQTLINNYGAQSFLMHVHALHDYGERIARRAWDRLPDGQCEFRDHMDDVGGGGDPVSIRVHIVIRGSDVSVDFGGSADQVPGNINCPLSVTAAAVYYCFFCLLPKHTPSCAGTFSGLRLTAPRRSLLNAVPPAAVGAGNVETSSRIVDTILGALARIIPERIPAASQGTMNNIAMGGESWDYYETLGGGGGGNRLYPGLSGCQSHMTNTRNTPVEIVEMHYPLRIHEYRLREQSAGRGLHAGGCGLQRSYQFTQPAIVTLISERRRFAPWGLAGGLPGATGVNTMNGKPLPGKTTLRAAPGDVLTIATPGGGGWGCDD